DGIAGKVRHLGRLQFYDVFTARFEMRAHLFPFALVGNHAQPDHRELRSDTHHHIGMVDRLAIETDAGEGDWLVAEIVGETANYLQVRAFRKRYVSEPVHVIEDQTAGTFQTTAFLFEIGVIDDIRDSINL